MAFICGLCYVELTTKPEKNLIRDVWKLHEKDGAFANGVFIPCGHVYHLGCISQSCYNQTKSRKGAVPVCPRCKVPCPVTGSCVTMTRLYPVIRNEEDEKEEENERDPAPELTPNPAVTVVEDASPSQKAAEPRQLFSACHAIVALFLFALVIQTVYYQLRHADKSNAADIEDEDVVDPRWVRQFYASFAVGVLVSCVAAFLFDDLTD